MDLTRRQLIQATGAALLPVRSGQSSGLSSGRLPGLPRFGLVTYMWGARTPLPELLDLCAETDVLGLELRTTHAHGVEPSLSKPARAEVRARFADSPVTLVGLGSNERYDSPDPAVVARAVATTTRFLELSHDVGAGGVKVKPDRLHLDAGIPEEQTLAQIGAALNGLGHVAADLGQEVRVEVHGQCAPPPRMARILEAADHPSVRVCWNSNAQDLEGEGLAAHFKLLRPWFGDTAHVRRLDHDGYPTRDLVDLMKASGYEGWVLLEQGGRAPEDLAAALRDQRERFASLVGDE